MKSFLDNIEDAREYLSAGRYAEALHRLPSADRVPRPFKAECRFLAAEAWRGRGFFLRAEGLYREILAGSRPADDPALWIEASLASAACLRSLGRTSEARARLARAASVARRYRVSAYRDGLDLEGALVDRAEGAYRKSLARLSAHLKHHLRSREWSEAAFVLWAMGGALRFAGDLAGSERAFRRSESLARRAGDPVGRGYALFGLGGVTRIAGRMKDSSRYYAIAKKLFDPTEDVFAKAYAYCGYANALRQSGRLREARRLYRVAHRLYSGLEDEVDLAYVDWGLGKIALQEGRLSEAGDFFAKAYRAFHRGHESRGEVLALLATAQILHAQGRTPLAEKTHARALRLAREHGLHAHLEVFT